MYVVLISLIFLFLHPNLIKSQIQTVATNNSDIYIPPAVQFFKSSKLYKCEIAGVMEKEIPAVKDSKTLENEGFLFAECGSKKYILSNKKEQYANIWKQCASLGGRSASIEQKSDLQCLHQRYIIQSGGNVSTLFFTGQLDENLNRSMISCSTNKTVPSDVWFEGEPNNAMKREACVAIKFDNKTAGLIDIRCGEVANLICEFPNVIKKAVPPYSSPTVIYYDKMYKNASNYCNLKLNCSSYAAAPSAFSQFCCESGMLPAVIETREEMNCMYNVIRNNSDPEISKIESYIIGFNDHTMKRDFQSCPDKIKLNEELWASSQPDNQGGIETCVVVNVRGKKDKIGLDDASFWSKFNPLCQHIVKPNITINNLKGNNDIVNNTYSNISLNTSLQQVANKTKKVLPKYSMTVTMYYKSMKYKKDICELFVCRPDYVMALKVEEKYKNDTTTGLMITECGNNHFFMSKKKVSVSALTQFCCDIGMRRAFTSSREELHCIYDAYINSKDPQLLSATSFGSGYWDQTLNRDFLTCPDKKRVPEELWKDGQPDNADGLQNLIIYNFKGTKDQIGFDDSKSLDFLYPICQFTKKNNTGVNISKQSINLIKGETTDSNLTINNQTTTISTSKNTVTEIATKSTVITTTKSNVISTTGKMTSATSKPIFPTILFKPTFPTFKFG